MNTTLIELLELIRAAIIEFGHEEEIMIFNSAGDIIKKPINIKRFAEEYLEFY